MKLAYWMYAGPAHLGTLRVASSFKNVHAIMHAPLGDDYFNVMRSMLERERDFTPVSASIVDRHVLARGSQEKVVENISRKDKEEKPDLILLTPTCTSSILQEDLQNFVNRALTFKDSQADVLLADVNHYRVNEFQAADRTFEQIVRFYIEKAKKENFIFEKTKKISANILGIFTLGFHNTHDCRELKRLLADLGIEINEIFPEGGNVNNLKNLPKAHFNIVPYREIGLMTANYLKNEFQMPYISTTPMGLLNTAQFIKEIEFILKNIYLQHSSVPAFSQNATLCCVPREQQKQAEQPHSLSKLNKAAPASLASLLACSRNAAKQPLSCGAERAHASSGAGFASHSTNASNRSPAPFSQNAACFAAERNACEQRTAANKHREEFEMVLEAESNGDEAVFVGFARNAFKQIEFQKYIDEQTRYVSQAAWFSRSIDCQNLTGKRAVVFGDATHAACITKILSSEMGIQVICSGTYCKHDADWFREQVAGFCDEILITEDHTQVGDMIARLEPAAIFGTQMERHVGKRLDIPCGVISAPVHIQNFPLGYRPFLGYEGTNQIADLIYNSFTLGMEDHLLEIFNGHDTKKINKNFSDQSLNVSTNLSNQELEEKASFEWSKDAFEELSQIPGFVRGKVKRNVEKFARKKNKTIITLDLMFAAKEALNA